MKEVWVRALKEEGSKRSTECVLVLGSHILAPSAIRALGLNWN